MLARRGAVVVDADQIARQLAAPTGACFTPIVEHFGPAVVREDGTLDRAAIAARVFNDPAQLAALNAITHPAIAQAIRTRLADLAARPEAGTPVVLDIALLNAATRDWYGLAAVVVVDAPVEVAVARLVEKRGMSEDDARARVRAQVSREDRRQLADVVVDNSGSREQLEARIDALWDWLQDLDRGSVDGPAQEASNADGAEHDQEQQ